MVHRCYVETQGGAVPGVAEPEPHLYPSYVLAQQCLLTEDRCRRGSPGWEGMVFDTRREFPGVHPGDRNPNIPPPPLFKSGERMHRSRPHQGDVD
jgi:hypothetical protein